MKLDVCRSFFLNSSLVEVRGKSWASQWLSTRALGQTERGGF